MLDDQRLKDPRGTDYFDELLERIRDIRASEKRFCQKVRDVFATSSVDYDSTSDAARTFFATILNKLCFAVTGHTAAELVVRRCDPKVTQTDRFLVFNEREVLDGPGRVSAESAREITARRYAEFEQRRRAEEAERAALEEWDDLRKLAAIERGLPTRTRTRRDLHPPPRRQDVRIVPRGHFTATWASGSPPM